VKELDEKSLYNKPRLFTAPSFHSGLRFRVTIVPLLFWAFPLVILSNAKNLREHRVGSSDLDSSVAGAPLEWPAVVITKAKPQRSPGFEFCFKMLSKF
jgi:hypothetical protein